MYHTQLLIGEKQAYEAIKSIQLFYFEHGVGSLTPRMSYLIYIESNLGITASTKNMTHANLDLLVLRMNNNIN